ncbi:ATP-binding protein [Dactylosporangium aurantiacum]|nr:ATP-binding protein [Dactylosporangium aurantiacum]MDG6101421.1 ATP-binding protein [Dactylosporangium aurantiacum]
MRVELVYAEAEQVSRFSQLPGHTEFGVALAHAGLLLLQRLQPKVAALPMGSVEISWLPVAQLQDGREVYEADGAPRIVRHAPPPPPEPPPVKRPDSITEGDATRIAYDAYIREVASFLRSGLSVLVACEKVVVPHLAEHIVRLSGQEPKVLTVPAGAEDQAEPPIDLRQLGGAQTSLRQRQLAQLRELLREITKGQVLVITHLDLLGGGSDSALANETRDLVDLLYGAEDPVMLAFSDPSLTLPEVLAARFAVRVGFEGSPRLVPLGGSLQPIERALVTVGEAERFTGIDTADFYKYVAGLNPVRLRQAIRYSYQETEGREGVTVKDLQENIRKFKAQASSSFEIPTVTFDHIGGYGDVKSEIIRALDVMARARELPDEYQELRGELIPRGFIFHGEPGTGKTLFAKAIANSMDATIQVVSGPEVTNKYVGESERKIRELFAEARRNAPAVIVFDEFDSIAASRSTADDGGSRAGNAMVAQILTEMDGFRPDVQMLVIGTTNRLEIIDRALLRPSRFQSFHIGLPDAEARRGIIEVHARRFHIDVSGLMEPLIVASEGWNGDEIRALFRDAFVDRWREDKAADAERLGELVGHYQRARREQQRSKAGRQ